MHGCVYFHSRAGEQSHAEDSAPAVEVVAARAVRHMAMRAQQRQQVVHLRLHLGMLSNRAPSVCIQMVSSDTTYACDASQLLHDNLFSEREQHLRQGRARAETGMRLTSSPRTTQSESQ